MVKATFTQDEKQGNQQENSKTSTEKSLQESARQSKERPGNERDDTPQRPPTPRGDGERRGEIRGNENNRDNPRRAPLELTAERRAELIAFAREHNPPIERLLNNLETKNPAQFRLAIQAMARDVQLLEDLKSRDPQRFELSLQLWQNRSRLDLLAAQVALQPETRRPALRRQMHQVMEQQNELRGKLLDLEIQRVAERQTRLEKSREELRNLSEADVRRQVSEVINRGRRNLDRLERTGPDRSESERNSRERSDTERNKTDGGAENRSENKGGENRGGGSGERPTPSR